MSSHFDYYARMARAVSDLTQMSGRYRIQADAERLIIADVSAKLQLRPSCELLEIGCGPGNLLIPLSFTVRRCVGIDHVDVLDRFRQRFPISNIDLIGGDFLEVELEEKFDRILIYSVLQTLPDKGKLIEFVEKAAKCLKKEGRMLIGDLSNRDKKNRFEASVRGTHFVREWLQLRDETRSEEIEPPTGNVVHVNDTLLMDLVTKLRGDGWHAYLYDQPQDLPFGNTREDILVVGPEYTD